MVCIVCVGIIVMDCIYYVEGLLIEGGKYVVKCYMEVGGGFVVIVVVVVVKLGVQVDFIGCVGDDDIGNSLLVELEFLGVNMCYICCYMQVMLLQLVIMVDVKGEWIIVNYFSLDLLFDVDWFNDIDFLQWDVVLVDVCWYDGVKQVFMLVCQVGVMIVFDGDIMLQDISELVVLSDYVVFFESGLVCLMGMSEVIDVLKKV